MAYQIQYGKPSKKEKAANGQRSRKIRRIKHISIVACLLTLVLLGRIGALDFLIPGDKAVTQSAFHAMVDNLKQGNSIKSAVTVFCEEIIAGA